ncbi:9594_t:CDS:2, partial [Diversispora eburnea]
HSSEDFAYSDRRNYIRLDARCDLCAKEHFIQEFKTWSKNGIKWNWNFIQQDWEYDLIGHKVALKEIKDSRFDMVEFLKMMKTTNKYERGPIAYYYGISKNPSTQNYITVMDLFDDNLHNFLTETFWDLSLKTKLDILFSIVFDLNSLNEKNLIHCNLHSGNNLINYNFDLSDSDMGIDLSSFDLFCEVSEKLGYNIVDDNAMRQLKIADENQKNTSKSQKQELLELFSHSNKLHPQSCYISRYIHTLHGLHDLLEEIKSGKSTESGNLKQAEKWHSTLNWVLIPKKIKE